MSVRKELLTLLHNITLFDSGFLDSLAHLVCLIIVPNGLFVSRIHCLSFTSLLSFSHNYFSQIAQTHPYGQFNYCTNGYVEHLIQYLSFLTHLVCLVTELNESFNIYTLCLF